MRPPTTCNGLIVVVTLGAICLTGCTGLRNTIPARALNVTDIADAPRSTQRPLNFMLLRQDPPQAYLLGPGDVLGVYIERILGQPTSAPPVHYPEIGDLPPAIGFPIPIREDGTIALPLISPLNMEGLTLTQAHRRILEAYTVERRLLPAGEERVLVSLMRPRTYNVLVIREDTVTGPRVMGSERQGELTLGRSKRGETYSIKLPAYENDVLGALSQTGGLPGMDAKNQVTIIRGGFDKARDNPILTELVIRMRTREPRSPAAVASPSGPGMPAAESPSPRPPFSVQAPPPPRDMLTFEPFNPSSSGFLGEPHTDTARGTPLLDSNSFGSLADYQTVASPSAEIGTQVSYAAVPPAEAMLGPAPYENFEVITIPLRIGPYDDLPDVRPEDIILQDGDVVFVESRDAEVFYTGGLLRGGQYPLPRDYDLDVLGAIAMAGGSISAAAGGTATGLNSSVGSIIPPSRITIVRQYQGQQIAIRTSTQDALTDVRERILIQPNDLVMLEYTPGEMLMNLLISNLNVSLSLNSLWN